MKKSAKYADCDGSCRKRYADGIWLVRGKGSHMTWLGPSKMVNFSKAFRRYGWFYDMVANAILEVHNDCKKRSYRLENGKESWYSPSAADIARAIIIEIVKQEEKK